MERMSFYARVNRFIEERLGIRSYPIKVVSLFSLVVLFSFILAFSIDVFLSFGEVKEDIRRASERAARFRTTAIQSAVLGMLQADLALSRLIEERGIETLLPFVGTYLKCVWDGNKLLGAVEEGLLKEALESSAGKNLYFYLRPADWTGISIIRREGKTYAFCHDVSHLESILSKRLGAIAKYGAEFYLGGRPEVSTGDVLVYFKSAYTNASMFVVVPSGNILRILMKERVLIYLRMYLAFVLFLVLSYLVWARLMNYPIRRLKEIVEELEKGNYDVDFEDMRRAKDEFGSIARLLSNYVTDIKNRVDKLELIVETAMNPVSVPEEIPGFIRKTINRLEEIFGSEESLFVVEEKSTGKYIFLIHSDSMSQEQVRSLLEFYRRKKEFSEPAPEELVCYRESSDSRGCRSIVLFKLNRDTEGALVFRFRDEMDRVNEEYLKVVCQHLVGTIRLSYLASTDPLTGVSNRRMLEHDLKNYGKLAKRYSKTLSLIMIDIDNFKSVNDTYGHKVGDEVLKRIANLLKESVRETDNVYRYGGEEFALLCPETDKLGAYELAERVRERVKTAKIHVGKSTHIYVTVSLGVASFPEDTENPEELLAVADISLYRAKSEGKDKTVVLSGSEDKEVYLHKFRVERELAELIRSGSFTYHLQPIYDIQKDRVFGYELLFRVIKDGEEIPIGRFINEIEDASLMEAIDMVGLENVVELLKQDELYRYIFFINVSPRTLERGSLFSELSRVPSYFRSRIYLEITERETFVNIKEALTYLDELKGLGYKIVMDDFGSGFSTLSSMRSFIKFIDLIKVDGSLVKGVSRDPYNRAILQSLKFMADKFSIDLVAEHIESSEDLQVVRSMGVRFGQGFYFGSTDIEAIA